MQTVNVNKNGVYQLDLNLGHLGAITFLSFCYPKGGGRADKLGRDERCLDDSECESYYCWADWEIAPDQHGFCRCNYNINEGCPDGKDCIGPMPYDEPPACFLPPGASCSTDADCYSDSCFDGKCAACSTLTDFPCNSSERCVDDLAGGFVCKAPGDGSIGSDCFESSDCNTNACYQTELFPPPGYCTCHSQTNAGGCKG